MKPMEVIPLKMDVSWQLLNAIRIGECKTIQDLLDCYNLSYSSAWAQGYVLLLTALEKNHKDIARMLLLRGAKVNSNNKRHTNTPLHYAAKIGDLELVEMILQRGGKVDARNIVGETPIHIAAKLGHLQIVRLFLNHFAYIGPRYVSSSEKYTPLHLSVKEGYGDITELLLAHHADINAKTSNGQTPLYIASMMGFSQIVNILLNHRPDFNSAMDNGHTPLHAACENDNVDVIKLLLNTDIEINQTANGGITPLHIATEKGHENIVNLLLAHGAKANIQDSKGHNALHYALIQTANEKKYENIANTFLEYGFCVDPIDVKNPKLFHDVITKGYLQVVKHFLELGANVNVKNVSKSYFERMSADMPLQNAVKHKHKELVTLLLRYGASVNTKDSRGISAIFYAIRNGDSEITKLLLSSGARTDNESDLLDSAIKVGCKEIIEILLEHGVNVNATDRFGNTALHLTVLNRMYSSEGDCKELIELLLAYGANINATDKSGKTALHCIVRKGLLGLCNSTNRGIQNSEPNMAKIVDLLLQKGIDVNIQTKLGITALLQAVALGSVEMVRKLLEYNADVNIQTNNKLSKIELSRHYMKYNDAVNYRFLPENLTVLHMAAQLGDELINRMLLEKGANVNVQLAETPLHTAIRNKHVAIVKLFLEFGAEIDNLNECGGTALHVACLYECEKIIKILLGYGSDLLLTRHADINAKTSKGETPLYIASMMGFSQIVKILLNHGADINSAIKNGYTPLHVACKNDSVDVIKLLLNNGIKINQASDGGITPLHIATQKGSENSVKLLLAHGANGNIPNSNGHNALHYALIQTANEKKYCRELQTLF